MAENGKMRILNILEMMQKTDELHPLNSTQMISKLRMRGINAERKTITRDIECLEDAGYEIMKCENHNMGWYMTGQEFEDYELKMLADAVAYAKFLTPKDSLCLIKKIKKMATIEGEKLIDSTLIMDMELKTDDKKFNLKFDRIVRAIMEHKQLRFQYYEYGKGKKKVLKRNGHVYQVNPYYIILSNGEYFLIANSISNNHVTHFRIEMITELDVLDETARPIEEVDELKEIGHGKSINDYLRTNVNMWEGESRDVTIRAPNDCKHDVMLNFGRNISIRNEDEEFFVAHIRVAHAQGFYYWLAAHGPFIKLLAPEDMQKDFVDFLKRSLNQY